MSMKPEIRVLIADDHPVVRQGLRQTIETDRGLKIVAEAGDGGVALEQIKTLLPDVAVLDIDMPVKDGFAVATAIREEKLPVAIIFLTIHREEELFLAAMDMGVKGYVLKDSATTDIIVGIKTVAGGQSYISPSLSAYLINRRARSIALIKENPGIQDLTSMERRVLKLIAEDKTSKEIAKELFISHRTVETHRTNISRKLELHGSLALIKFAVAHKSQL
jgi:DNA-binding NarL/FixJ family response regulator